jgi:transcriptional regulator with XRE-family HTH domain
MREGGDHMLRISLEREKRGWSKTRLGIRADVNPVSIGQIELGRVPAWPAWRKRISQALGVSVEELFDSDGHPLEMQGGVKRIINQAEGKPCGG